MFRCAAIVMTAVAAAADVQVPPGYRIIQVTQGPEFDWGVSMNNVGQVVFHRRFDVNDMNTEEIFLYDSNTASLTRLTNDYVRDAFPDINDNGTMVWQRGIGPPGPYGATTEIVRYENGALTRITNDAGDDRSPRINAHGHFAWYKWTWQGCEASSSNIYFHGDQGTIAVTGELRSNQAVSINDFDEIAWTSYDFCPFNWTSRIMLYSSGTITQISSDDYYEVQAPTINNLRQVAWQFWHNDGSYSQGIQLWEQGQLTVLLDWGQLPHLNNRGDLEFIRWYDATHLYQKWVIRDGHLFQLSDDPFKNLGGDINDKGEVAWQSGNYPWTDIRLLSRLPAGDLNCDGSINAFDIEPFVTALSNSDAYSSAYPNCDLMLADVNGDGSVSQFDIQPFIDLLTP